MRSRKRRPIAGACIWPVDFARIRAPAGDNLIYLRSAEGWSAPGETVTVVEGQETKSSGG